MDWTVVLVAMIGSGALSATISWLAGRRQSEANAAESNVKTAIVLRDEAIEERDYLRQQVDTLAARVTDLERMLEQRAREWEIAEGVIRHQSHRIEELTRALTIAESELARLRRDIHGAEGNHQNTGGLNDQLTT